MKRFLLIALVLFSMNCFSQEYMDAIVAKTCDCISLIPDTINLQQFNISAGTCMIEAAMPYKKEIKKDLKINLDKLGTDDGEQLGRIIGIKMAGTCPKVLLKWTNRSDKEEAAPAEDRTMTGVVTKIERDFFVVFSIKDETGKVSKFYWLGFIESEDEMISKYTSLEGELVNISYKTEEFFDPKINEYRQFSIVTKLEISKK